MIIDFHSHIFPDKIASSTISALESKSNGKAYTDGTVNGLIKSITENNVDISITLPVLTKPTQFDSVTRFVLKVNDKFLNSKHRIISFAGMHPRCEDIYNKMKYLKENGIKGVKIHPDYQFTYIDDPGYIEIINCAKELDMIVVTHSGIDDGYIDNPIMCPPERVLKVIKETKWNKLVLGHDGAHKQWEQVLDMIAGEDVYFDTAFTFYKIEQELFKKILYKHGVDKVLFATDSPWSDLGRDIKVLKSYNLNSEDLEKIFYKNACKLLNIKVNNEY